MKDKLLFWINSEFLHFGIAKILQDKYDFDMYAIIDIHDVTKQFFIEQKLVKFQKSWYYRDYISNINKKPDIKYLASFEEKYGINLWQLAYSERKFFQFNIYYKIQYDEILSILELECKLFEKILEEINPDYLLIPLYSGHHPHLLCQMCRSKGIKVLMLTLTRVGYRTAITSHFDKLDRYDEIAENTSTGKSRPLTELQHYMNTFNVTKQKEEKRKWHASRISKWQKLAAGIRFLTVICNDDYRKYYHNYGKTRFQIVYKGAILLLKKWYSRNFLNKFSVSEIDTSMPFVYYPLHVEPERTLSFEAPFFTNQLDIIRHIAKSLPIGYKLLVKEHPDMKMAGWRDVSFYKKILELPNAVLIHPSTDSRKLIEKSSLVITINGSAGLEAAFYKKPSIVFTDTVYSTLPFVHKVVNFSELPQAIRSSLKKEFNLLAVNKVVNHIDRNTFEFNLEQMLSDVSSYFFHGGYLGNVVVSVPKMKSFLEKYETYLEKLASEYAEEIERYKRKVNTNKNTMR